MKNKVGVLGGGQLGRMLALAGYPLGISVLCYEPSEATSASDVTRVIRGAYNDKAALQQFAEQVDVVTVETENVPLETAQWVNEVVPFCPSLKALEVSQDRLFEKTLFQSLGIMTAEFVAVDTFEQLEHGVEVLGLPCILKTRREGYDGKGQYVIHSKDMLADVWSNVEGQALILESFVDFDLEVSLILVRSQQGELQSYPLVKNTHQSGILRLSEAPYKDAALLEQACQYGQKVAEALSYQGVLTIEFFCCKGTLVANEMAPRVHNSGHWTIEGAAVSQFENHLRALLDWPLGATTAPLPCAMVNLIGQHPCVSSLLSTFPDLHYHDYNKTARAGRKLAHATLVRPEMDVDVLDHLCKMAIRS